MRAEQSAAADRAATTVFQDIMPSQAARLLSCGVRPLEELALGKVACICGNVFSTTGSPNDSMHVVRDRDMVAYSRHVWRSYQLSDVERSGMLPLTGSVESEQFHESLYASLDLEGELWQCPVCGRLLFRQPGEQELRSFVAERGAKPAEQIAAADRPRDKR